MVTQPVSVAVYNTTISLQLLNLSAQGLGTQRMRGQVGHHLFSLLLVCQITAAICTAYTAPGSDRFTALSLCIIRIKEALTLSIQHPNENREVGLRSVQGRSKTSLQSASIQTGVKRVWVTAGNIRHKTTGKNRQEKAGRKEQGLSTETTNEQYLISALPSVLKI